MILVRVDREEERREILEKKRKLKGRREKMMDDWTWKERRMRWKLEEIARKEEREGRKLKDGKRKGIGRALMARWDEEVLKDGRGNVKMVEWGKDKKLRKKKGR